MTDIRAVAVIALCCAGAACGPRVGPIETPIPMRVHGDAAAAEHVYILLPGLRDDLDTFAETGFIDIARKALAGRERAAFVAVDAHLGYYQDRSIERRIRDEVAARFAGKKLTVVGVSLGGVGALATERRFPGLFSRIVLFAPFLGRRDQIERLRNGTGPLPGDDLDRELFDLWKWLVNGDAKPPITILYGRDDDFRIAYEYLAERVPAISFRVTDGGHRWRVWNALWRAWLSEDRQR